MERIQSLSLRLLADTCYGANILRLPRKTCEQGVLIDCAKRDTGANATNSDDYWLHMYVMLSRATSLRDLLLIRAPEATFLLQGPPRDLKKRLWMFRARVDKCKKYAESIASQLGFQTFLR